MKITEPGAPPPPPSLRSIIVGRYRAGIVSWPAWLRLIAVLPMLVILWLGTVWALTENIT